MDIFPEPKKHSEHMGPLNLDRSQTRDYAVFISEFHNVIQMFGGSICFIDNERIEYHRIMVSSATILIEPMGLVPDMCFAGALSGEQNQLSGYDGIRDIGGSRNWPKI